MSQGYSIDEPLANQIKIVKSMTILHNFHLFSRVFLNCLLTLNVFTGNWENLLLLSKSKAFANIFPIHDAPYGLEIIRPHILVLEVVSVFPHIHTKDRNEV